jgi:glycerol-3-phosphate dehydrogenase (NAD(P)+)
MSDWRIPPARSIGVEVAGFYKNVIAIAAGALTELHWGNNARAALVTRALAEMGRLVDYFGGDPATLSGLAGIAT